MLLGVTADLLSAAAGRTRPGRSPSQKGTPQPRFKCLLADGAGGLAPSIQDVAGATLAHRLVPLEAMPGSPVTPPGRDPATERLSDLVLHKHNTKLKSFRSPAYLAVRKLLSTNLRRTDHITSLNISRLYSTLSVNYGFLCLPTSAAEADLTHSPSDLTISAI